MARLANGQAEVQAALQSLAAGLGDTVDLAGPAAGRNGRSGRRLSRVEQLSVSEQSR